jgi:Flp pilus assembly protein TadG
VNRRFWNDQRGAAAWFVTAALIPLLGMMSLGSEVGSWYVIRRQAQNAADAAAIAGATALLVNDANGAVSAGQAFATSNGFAPGDKCSATPTSSQAVCITSTASSVTAVIAQYQQPIFTQWFIDGRVKIRATATAQIQTKPGYCALALTKLDLSGNSSLDGNCGLASNGTFAPPPAGQDPFDVPTGSKNIWTVQAKGDCTGNDNKCNLGGNVQSYQYDTGTSVPIPPALDNLMKGKDNIPAEPSKPSKVNGNPLPNTGTWLGNYTFSTTTPPLSPGVYMFDSLQVDAPLNVTGVNIIIGSGGLSGSGSLTLTAGSGGSFPDMNGVAIYDMEGTDVRYTGQFSGNFNGALYFPKANLTFRGGAGLAGCMVVVANVLSVGPEGMRVI